MAFPPNEQVRPPASTSGDWYVFMFIVRKRKPTTQTNTMTRTDLHFGHFGQLFFYFVFFLLQTEEKGMYCVALYRQFLLC